MCERPLAYAHTLQASQALQDVQDAQATATSELTLQINTLMQQLQEANAELLKLQGEVCKHHIMDLWDMSAWLDRSRLCPPPMPDPIYIVLL